jgi:hypothetical protein
MVKAPFPPHTYIMRLILPVLVFVAFAGMASAMEVVGELPANGGLAIGLTQNLYCDMKGLLSGSVGLMIGFAVALLGLMKIIQGSTGTGIIFILMGAAVTALPNIVESTIGGIGSVLYENDISTRAPGPGMDCEGWSGSVSGD